MSKRPFLSSASSCDEHRIASYNARYQAATANCDLCLCVPGPERKLVQVGKPGAYEFEDGTPDQSQMAVDEIKAACIAGYQVQTKMLEAGIAREVARAALPVSLYSSMYVTMNARSLMNFLSLRTTREGTHFPSFPQREIEMVAEKMEAFWETSDADDSRDHIYKRGAVSL
jgi:thymidylate synthase, flavin-dependent